MYIRVYFNQVEESLTISVPTQAAADSLMEQFATVMDTGRVIRLRGAGQNISRLIKGSEIRAVTVNTV